MYNELDKRILQAVTDNKDPYHPEAQVTQEALRLHHLTGHKMHTIVSMRLQYLRKAGKIKYLTMQRSPVKRAGWVVV